ncbi:2OG-Fe(II) oxygenase family protein, partial [Nereida sp. MMG025]|uniref:2OG-Fe(II) oxygenase family protein n=1 Tax=Nereida sp. MMG025 TaxID=2909981 RepID=UPI00272ED9AE
MTVQSSRNEWPVWLPPDYARSNGRFGKKLFAFEKILQQARRNAASEQPENEVRKSPLTGHPSQSFQKSAMRTELPFDCSKMTQHMSKPISQLRLLHYVRHQEMVNHQSVNMGAHTDYECLTLLHTRNEGLQVMTQNNQWIDVPVDPAVLVVNIGDMLEAWSNG